MSKLEVLIRDQYENLNPKVLVHNTEQPEWEAGLASILIERWGLVAIETDGEDTGGRQKVRRLTPQELVTQACDTAALAVAEFRSRGWVLAVPSFAEAEQILADRSNGKAS